MRSVQVPESPEARALARLARVPFLGRAAVLRGTDDEALISEAGKNYDAYHAIFRELWIRFGGPLNPADFGDPQDYAAAVSATDDLLALEANFRHCQRANAGGLLVHRLGQADATPLVDASGELVSVSGRQVALSQALATIGSNSSGFDAHCQQWADRGARRRSAVVPATPTPRRPDFSARPTR